MICQHVLDVKYAEWLVELRRRWQEVHSQFDYALPTDSHSVTMNKKIYFRTVTDVNRYSVFLRKIVMKIMKFVNRKIIRMQGKWFNRWKGNIALFTESDLKYGHFSADAIDYDANISTSAHSRLFPKKLGHEPRCPHAALG